MPDWNGSLRIFADFRTFLDNQIQGYFEKLKEYRKGLTFDEEGALLSDQTNTEAEISALRNDINLFQEANKNLHKRIKTLEEENQALKDKIREFLIDKS